MWEANFDEPARDEPSDDDQGWANFESANPDEPNEE